MFMKRITSALLVACLGSAGCVGGGARVPSRSAAVPEGESRGAQCADAALAVQVLGSGGPVADDGRASSAYLIWIDGHARVLVDAGSGLLPRFGAAGARLPDLDVVALSHLHVDHSAGLAGLLKSGSFGERERALVILGPSGNDGFPDIEVFLQRLLDPESGAYRYLGGYLDGQGSLFPLEPTLVGPSSAPATVFSSEGLSVKAAHVRHGQVPALGFVVQVGETRIAFTGDQSARDQAQFVEISAGADLMIAHHAIAEDDTSLRHLHMTPSEIGELARDAGVQRLVLSHNMRRSLEALPEGREAIRRAYTGPLEVAHDLQCLVLR
jgi:ribonuclease BN (tRNA processing enzyme)